MNTVQAIDKREKLFGIVICFFLVVCFGYYIYTSIRGGETLGDERFHKQLTSAGLAIETEVLELRKLEQEFVIRRKLDIRSKFLDQSELARDNIQTHLVDNGISIGDALQHSLEAYVKSAQDLFEIYIKNGLDHDSGLEGKLRVAAHSAERRMKELKAPLLLSELMYLRRHEKDLILRGDFEYVEKFNKRMTELQILSELHIGTKDQKGELLADLKAYEYYFGQWSDNRKELDRLVQQTEFAFEVVSREMKSLIRQAVSISEESEQAGNTHRTLSVLLSISLGGLILIAISLLVHVIFRHKKLTSKVDKLAYSDSLTSLPNRRCFFRELEQKIFFSQKIRTDLSIGIIDLDGFKSINDIHGHGAGDQLLLAVGERLRSVLNEKIHLARLGGDEFGIIIYGTKTDQELLDIGESICAALRQPFPFSDVVARIGGSVGFAQFPKVAENANTLFEYADFALYHAKENCKGRAVLFSSEHELEISGKRQLEQCLLEADLEAELDVHFQPIVDSVDGQVVGMEALARWISPEIGFVSPDKFISAAEHLGIVGQLSSVLFKKAIAAAKNWPDHTYLSFNLSAIDLSSKETALKLMAIIMENGFPPNRIVFEITETTMMLNFAHANEILEPFRKMGVEIALDDFGTGYSSLSYIQKMPIDRLKVDRAFISDIETRKTTRDIMATVVDLCESLEIKCIVEGVETHKQLETVELLGCRLIQGYYFSKPLRADDALAFLEERQLHSINDWQCIA